MKRFWQRSGAWALMAVTWAGIGRHVVWADEEQRQQELRERERAVGEHPRDVVHIGNGWVVAEISAGAGRIVRFGRSDGPNLLWLNDAERVQRQRARGEWVNIGGDKVWPAVQEDWPRLLGQKEAWPPDRDIDGAAWRLVDVAERRVVIESPVSRGQGVRVRREVVLEEAGPRLRIHNSVEQVERGEFRAQVWSVTQVRPPDLMLMDMSCVRPEEEPGWRFLLPWGDVSIKVPLERLREPAVLVVRPGAYLNNKIGVRGRWIAAVFGEDVLVQRQSYDPKGSYAEEASLELYMEREYVELETLSPAVKLEAGGRLEHTVTWELLKIEAGTAVSVMAQRIAEGEKAVSGPPGP